MAQATLDEYIDKPRSQGVDISFNVLAADFTAGSRTPIINSFFNTMLSLPLWLTALPKEQFVQRLHVRSFRNRMKDLIFSGTFKFGMLPPRNDPYWMDCFRIAHCTIREYEGKTVGEIARSRSPHRLMDAVYNQSIEAIFDMLIADPNTTWDFILDKRAGPIIQDSIPHPSCRLPLHRQCGAPARPAYRHALQDVAPLLRRFPELHPHHGQPKAAPDFGTSHP